MTRLAFFVMNGSSSTYTNINYSLSSGAGTKNAGFSGVLEGESPVKKAAFYPYGSDASYDGSKISLTLKDTIIIRKEKTAVLLWLAK